MKELFDFTGLTASVRKDGDVDIKVVLVTTVAPVSVERLLTKLVGLHRGQVLVDLKPTQMVLPGSEDADPGKVRELVNRKTGEVTA